MDNTDIENEILSYLEIDDIINYCKHNKKTNEKCLSSNFWIPYFRKHGLPLPKNMKLKSSMEQKISSLKILKSRQK